MNPPEVYRMLGATNLWQATVECDRVLREASIPHAIVEGVAVCLHGYQRNTVDLDVLVRRQDASEIRCALQSVGYKWDATRKEFQNSSGVVVQFVTAGDRAGNDSLIRLPDPSVEGISVEIEGVSVIALPRLVETKIACGLGNIRRTHKDFADVVEMIAINRLDGSFARHLDKTIRPTYRKLVRMAQG